MFCYNYDIENLKHPSGSYHTGNMLNGNKAMTRMTAFRSEMIHNEDVVIKAKALTAFKHYTSAFDQSNFQVANKIRHTWHVADHCERIASELGCNAELAWLIGVLHDIGRFEQIRVVHGYDDSKGIDHGDYGESLLFEEGIIRELSAMNQLTRS